MDAKTQAVPLGHRAPISKQVPVVSSRQTRVLHLQTATTSPSRLSLPPILPTWPSDSSHTRVPSIKLRFRLPRPGILQHLGAILYQCGNDCGTRSFRDNDSHLAGHQLHLGRTDLPSEHQSLLWDRSQLLHPSGTLGEMQANISTMSEQLQSHTEVVDFTGSQSLWSYSTYNSFAAPLTNHRILFFMSTLYIVATSTVPIYMDLSYSIIDSGSYSMTLTVGYNVSITRYSFSQIFFNIGEYESTISPYLYGL